MALAANVVPALGDAIAHALGGWSTGRKFDRVRDVVNGVVVRLRELEEEISERLRYDDQLRLLRIIEGATPDSLDVLSAIGRSRSGTITERLRVPIPKPRLKEVDDELEAARAHQVTGTLSSIEVATAT